jgi:hypothetical protein
MACPQKLPFHFVVFSEPWIPSNKEHWLCTFKLACTTIWKHLMFTRLHPLITQPLPTKKQTMLHKKSVMFFVITIVKVWFFYHLALTTLHNMNGIELVHNITLVMIFFILHIKIL